MRDEYVNADGLGTETMLQNNRIDQFRYLYNQPKKNTSGLVYCSSQPGKTIKMFENRGLFPCKQFCISLKYDHNIWWYPRSYMGYYLIADYISIHICMLIKDVHRLWTCNTITIQNVKIFGHTIEI